MRTNDEINDYIKEAHDRVWVVRKQDVFENSSDEYDQEEIRKYQEEICYICNEYDIDFYNSVTDWYYGYWCGILSALRWIMGEDKDFVDIGDDCSL